MTSSVQSLAASVKSVTREEGGGEGVWAGILQGGGGYLGSSKRQVRGNFPTDKQNTPLRGGGGLTPLVSAT